LKVGHSFLVIADLGPTKKPNRPDDKEQSKLFIEKAREIGADEEKSGG